MISGLFYCLYGTSGEYFFFLKCLTLVKANLKVPMKKSRHFILGLSLTLLFIALDTSGQKRLPEINQTKEHIVKSKVNGTSYYLSVSLPQHYSSQDTTRYPVLFLLDGNITFPIVHANRIGLDFFGGLEQVIIVGVGYEFELSYLPWVVSRWTDLTPSLDLKTDSNPSTLKTLGLQEGGLKSGGASAFVDVLRKEIIPLLNSKYKTTKDRGIIGHSYGGLFATYCLFSAPDLFNRYGILSPSLWWNNREMVALEKVFAKKNQQLNAQVFMSVGEKEQPISVTAFADTLVSRNYKGFTLTSKVFEGESHLSVIPSSVCRALSVLYPSKKK